MPEVETFFRHCPSCGRRFEIRLVSKKLIGSEEFVEKEKVTRVLSPRSPLILNEDMPCIVDAEEFQYAYRCKHCGHEWSEVREKDDIERSPKGYTGD